jgi:hypothetical protein
MDQVEIPVTLEKKMHLFRLDLDNGDTIVLRFPDKETAEKYLNCGDEGYDLCQILSSMVFATDPNPKGYIELGEITDRDTIIDWRHFNNK